VATAALPGSYDRLLGLQHIVEEALEGLPVYRSLLAYNAAVAVAS